MLTPPPSFHCFILPFTPSCLPRCSISCFFFFCHSALSISPLYTVLPSLLFFPRPPFILSISSSLIFLPGLIYAAGFVALRRRRRRRWAPRALFGPAAGTACLRLFECKHTVGGVFSSLRVQTSSPSPSSVVWFDGITWLRRSRSHFTPTVDEESLWRTFLEDFFKTLLFILCSWIALLSKLTSRYFDKTSIEAGTHGNRALFLVLYTIKRGIYLLSPSRAEAWTRNGLWTLLLLLLLLKLSLRCCCNAAKPQRFPLWLPDHCAQVCF